MYALIKYNSNYQELVKECKKKEITLIPLLNLTLTRQKDKNKETIQNIKNIVKKNNFENSAIIITLNSIDNTTQGIINQLKQEFDIIIGEGGLNKVNRFFLEQTQIDFLLDPHNSRFKVKFDFIHHFNSGLNHVLCKFARDKNIGIINSLNFLNTKSISIIKDISRISQNIRFARKYNISIYSNTIIEKKEDILSQLKLESIQKQLSMDTNQIKISKNILENKITQNKHKKSKNHITTGLEKIN